jgi:hypothetical protein
MIRYLLSRIGCLMLIAGAILLILSFAAIRSDQPGFNLLFIGIGLFGVGFLLWNRLRVKHRENSRFSIFRKRGEKDDRKEGEADQFWKDGFDD